MEGQLQRSTASTSQREDTYILVPRFRARADLTPPERTPDEDIIGMFIICPEQFIIEYVNGEFFLILIRLFRCYR